MLHCPYLEAKQLSYQVGSRHLVSKVSLALYPNELTVIIGPNGAGKSTLLRLLTGYLKPSNGYCYFLDKPLFEWSAKELAQHRVVMSQQQPLHFPFSAQQIIAMGCAPYPLHQQSEILQQSLALTETQHLAALPYLSLSGGEQQRIQFARAIAQLGLNRNKPSYLFLDEPTSALDLGHQQKMLRLLRQLVQQRQLGVCCVLHDLNLAALYADRIIVMHQGECLAYGSVDEVLQQQQIAEWYQAELQIEAHPYYSLPHVYLKR